MPNPRRRRRAGAPLRLGAARRRIAGPLLRHTPPDLDAVIEGDRAFFRARPDRSYRMRPTEPAETDAFARAGQPVPPLLPGNRWVTVVHQVVPGGRVRRLCQLPEEQDIDPPESVVADLSRFLAGEPGTVIGRLAAESRGSLH